MAGRKRIPTEQRRTAFATDYLTNGRKATHAAVSVGVPEGSAATQGSKWLRHPQVAKIIAEADSKAADEVGIELVRVTAQLDHIVMADVGQALNPDGSFRPLHQWPEHLRRAVASVEMGTKGRGAKAKSFPKKVKFWNKVDAADKLIRVVGGYAAERHEVEVTVTTLADDIQAAQARLAAERK